MESIKQWVICIIFSSIITVIISIFVPDGSVQRAVKIVVSTFLLCVFFSPLLIGENLDLSDLLYDFSYYEASIEDEVSDVMFAETENAVKNKAKELIKELGVESYEIDVDLYVNSQNEICVKTIKVSLDEKYHHREKQISSNLKTMFLAEVEFVWKKR